MTSYTLSRTDAPPIAFVGELLTRDEEPAIIGDGRYDRWHAIRVYRVHGREDCAYVAQIEYGSNAPQEVAHNDAQPCATLQELAAYLRDYNPTAHVAGFPPSPTKAMKQARLLADIERRFRHNVGRVLAELREPAEQMPPEGHNVIVDLDLATAAAAMAELPEADRRARLDALANALRGLPLAERAALAAKLLDGAR